MVRSNTRIDFRCSEIISKMDTNLYLFVMLVFLHVEGVEIEEFVLPGLVQAAQCVQDGQVEVAYRGSRIVLGGEESIWTCSYCKYRKFLHIPT